MSEKKIKDGLYKIRPAGRHIITIGKDLIKDKYAAIVELVKNAYDADSPSCIVSLLPFEKKIMEDGQLTKTIRGIKIIVSDKGHGMTFETVTDKWMVPSTDDKYHREKSPGNRLMQGKKGIGRYSASMIGDDMILQTIDKYGALTTLYLIWKDFESAKYLEDVDVLIENFETKLSSGTEIIVVGDEKHLSDWDEKQLKNLKSELRKLIPPIDRNANKIEDDTENFKITLELGDFPYDNYSNRKEDIEPYPLFDLFDYRISGIVTADGVANLKFENKRVKNSPAENIKPFKIILNQQKNKRDIQNYCGEINVDFRVFDKDPSSIDTLIERGLKDPHTGESVGKREARIILNTFNGIGVYRNGFRIRPLGDAGFDWLELDRERVQNPSMKIGSDQIIGFIHIKSENQSGLEEKSARDGLRETPEYFGLQEISKQVLLRLEQRRFIYRQRVGLGRSKNNLTNQINTLFDFNEVQSKINNELEHIGVDKDSVAKINLILKEKETVNNKIASDLKKSIALYQGQATIGKIVNIIMHEGRKPLAYFINQFPRIKKWSSKLQEEYNPDILNKITDRLSVAGEQAIIFEKLFRKIDPLSSKRRDHKKDFNFRTVIEDVKDVFYLELKNQSIEYEIVCDKNLSFCGWKEDFYVAFTNLVDNSLYWLQDVKGKRKTIQYKVFVYDGLLTCEYRDNGPGIEKELIESEVIFEPEFSNKTGSGSGLGLAISGEAIQRNDGKLKAIYSDNGAFFKIEVKL